MSPRRSPSSAGASTGSATTKADIRRVQEWMGHADIQTTMRYLHYAPRSEDAELVAEAFRVESPPPVEVPE
jgi:integrase